MDTTHRLESTARLLAIEKDSGEALSETAPRLAELRLNLAAIALRRAQPEPAAELLERARTTVEGANGTGLRAAWWQLQSHVSAEPLGGQARARVNQLLEEQQRLYFDPVSVSFVGAPIAAAQGNAQRIRAIAEEVRSRRSVVP